MVSSAGAFVVKLPSQRVEALEAAHQGKKFEAGKGRRMKEWLGVFGVRFRFILGISIGYVNLPAFHYSRLTLATHCVIM